MSWTLTNFLAAFLLPPLNLFMLGLAGLFLRGRRRMLGGLLIGASLLGLVVLSTPIVSFWLLDSLKPAPVPITGKEADAIVILGGGRDINSLEFGGDTLSRYSLERARYGAWLARRLGKPILVTGGMPGGGSRSEGEIMAEALNREFGVKVRWVENQAENTRENARLSAALLVQDGIHRVYLVTHCWHLRRAMPEFEATGLTVIPAGTGYSLPSPANLLDFLPSARALDQSYSALHEWIGVLWYRIRD